MKKGKKPAASSQSKSMEKTTSHLGSSVDANTPASLSVPAGSGVTKMTKADRRAIAIKKSKRNRKIAISIGALAAIVFIVLVIYSVTRPEIPSRIYATGPQSITLYEDGRFSFVDCRFVRTGRFTEIESNDDVMVEFVHNNITVFGNITDDVLTIPWEWDSGKGHSPHLRLQ